MSAEDDIDWSTLHLWHDEHRAMTKFAADLRDEAEMFREGWLEAQSEKRWRDAAALRLSMFAAKTRAARIERDLRGLPEPGA